MTVAPALGIGGVSIARIGLDDAVRESLAAALDHVPLALRFTNTWCIVLADRDPDYRALLNDSGTNFADGRPVADEVSRRTGHPNPHVRGQSFFEAALERGQEPGVRHFFYGADEPTLEALEAVVRDRFPGVTIAGSLAPPFGSADQLSSPELLNRIRAAHPDLVWVGLGTPKQDVVATTIARELGVTTAAVGAAFDFIAGTKSTAPAWMQKAKLEWLFRFVSEPRRLWKRYTVGILEYGRIIRRDRRDSTPR